MDGLVHEDRIYSCLILSFSWNISSILHVIGANSIEYTCKRKEKQPLFQYNVKNWWKRKDYRVKTQVGSPRCLNVREAVEMMFGLIFHYVYWSYAENDSDSYIQWTVTTITLCFHVSIHPDLVLIWRP